MRRNSDKLARLARRNSSLIHALKNDFSEEKVTACAERVRQAVLTALKKFKERRLPRSDSMNNDYVELLISEIERLRNEWNQIPTGEIINITEKWPKNPNYENIGINLKYIFDTTYQRKN